MPYDPKFKIPKKELVKLTHKQRFGAIGAACRNAVAASGETPLSKGMWSEYGKCLKDSWKGLPKAPKTPTDPDAKPKKSRAKAK